MRPARATALLLGMCWAQVATAAEYRRVTLMDGRVLVAEMREMNAEGIILELPQGITMVEPTQVMNLETITEEDFQAQEPWAVVVLPFVAGSDALQPAALDAEGDIALMVGALPGVFAVAPSALSGELNAAEIEQLLNCGIDAACAAPVAREGGLDVVIMGSVGRGPQANELLLVSVYAEAPRAQRQVALPLDADLTLDRSGAWAALHTALHLEPDPAALPPRADATVVAAPPVAPPEPPPDPVHTERVSEQTLRRLSWIPVPGLPSLARRDLKGFATSWGVVVPGSVAMVGVAGYSSFRSRQFAAVGILSYCALTVATNRVIGLRGIEDFTVQAAPAPDGGMTLQVGARR